MNKETVENLIEEFNQLKTKMKNLEEKISSLSGEEDRESEFPKASVILKSLSRLENNGSVYIGTTEEYGMLIVKKLRKEYEDRERYGIKRQSGKAVTDDDLIRVANSCLGTKPEEEKYGKDEIADVLNELIDEGQISPRLESYIGDITNELLGNHARHMLANDVDRWPSPEFTKAEILRAANSFSRVCFRS